MTKLISIEFQNFQSYGNASTKIDLTKSGTTMIIGKNVDDGGSNGVGKSTIINAISYALYDKAVSDISKDKLINNVNGKNMEVIINFEKNNIMYKVRRYRKMKGNGVELYENGKDITPDSTSHTNDAIERILGMPHELFVNVVVFSATNTQFLNLSMRDQANMLEELLDIKMISEKATALKLDIKDATTSFGMEYDRINRINVECRRFIEQLSRAQKRSDYWEKEHTQDLIDTRVLLKELENVDIDTEIKLASEVEDTNKVVLDTKIIIRDHNSNLTIQLNNEIDLEKSIESEKDWDANKKENLIVTKSELAELNVVDTDTQFDLHAGLKESQSNLEQQQRELKKFEHIIMECEAAVDENKKELKHLKDATCPYCKQEFKETKEKITECAALIKKDNSRIESCNFDMVKLNMEISDIQKTIDSIKKDTIYSLPEIRDIKQAIAVNENKLETLENSTNPHTPQTKCLIEKTDIELIESLKKQISDRKSELEIQEVKLKSIQEKRTMSIDQIDAHERKLEKQKTLLDVKEKNTNELLKPFQELTESTLIEDPDMTFLQLFAKHKLPNDFEKLYDMFNKEHGNETTKILEQQNDPHNGEFDVVKETDRSNELHKLLEHQKFLLKLLTQKNSFIRKSMLNQTIPLLNKRLDGYLKEMGLPHSVIFTPEMGTKISRFGNMLDYGNLSNGQQCRVNLALSFAFRDLLQHLHDPINVCILDEVLDVGLDSEGIQKAASMIKQKSTQDDTSILVISHRDEIDNTFSNKMLVQMKNGFSSVVDTAME